MRVGSPDISIFKTFFRLFVQNLLFSFGGLWPNELSNSKTLAVEPFIKQCKHERIHLILSDMMGFDMAVFTL